MAKERKCPKSAEPGQAVIGVQVMCSSPTAPGLDGKDYAYGEISFWFPGQDSEFVATFKLTPNMRKPKKPKGGYPNGDNTSDALQQISDQIDAAQEDGSIPEDADISIEYQEQDSGSSKKYLGRIILNDVLCINGGSTHGKVKLEPGYITPKPPRVRVVTPPPIPIDPPPPPPPPPAGKPPTTPPPTPTKPKKPKTVKPKPVRHKGGKLRRHGKASPYRNPEGWEKFVAQLDDARQRMGVMAVATGALVAPDFGGAVQVPFLHVPGSAEAQMAEMMMRLELAGFETHMEGGWLSVIADYGGEPVHGLQILGSTSLDSRGAFPWIVLLGGGDVAALPHAFEAEQGRIDAPLIHEPMLPEPRFHEPVEAHEALPHVPGAIPSHPHAMPDSGPDGVFRMPGGAVFPRAKEPGSCEDCD